MKCERIFATVTPLSHINCCFESENAMSKGGTEDLPKVREER